MAIEKISIDNFKCFNKETLIFGNMSILTGIHSSGKSTVIQALRLATSRIPKEKLSLFQDYNSVRNKRNSHRTVVIDVDDKKAEIRIDLDNKQCNICMGFKNKFLFLSDIQSVVEDSTFVGSTEDNPIGDNGEFVFDLFFKNKDKVISQELRKDPSHHTLSAQVSAWLSYIINLNYSLEVKEINARQLSVEFKDQSIDASINPFLVGTGLSYLVKVIITALMTKKDQTLVLENPDLFLHPKAQSRLGELFCTIANSGVQLIFEVHSTNIIDRVRYEVFSKKLDHNSVRLFYKSNQTENFQTLCLNEDGKYISFEDKCLINFPSGFFDATLDELLEMG